MGVVKGVSWNEFPKQSRLAGQPVKVVFNYDTSKEVDGEIVRDDCEEPYVTIISLYDGRFILATECQFQINKEISRG